MKRVNKIILFFVLHISVMLIIPFLTVKLAPAESGMGICMLLFFAGYPAFSMAIGHLSYTDFKFLWWMPLLNAITFPLLFSAAMAGMVWELYVYSAIYLFLGYAVATFLLIVKKIRIERQK